jgi:hypothetical protein
VVFDDVDDLARHAVQRRGVLDHPEQLGRPRLTVFLVLRGCVCHHHRIHGERMKRRRDCDAGNSRVQRFRERDALADRLLGELRAIGRDQDVLVHDGVLLSVVPRERTVRKILVQPGCQTLRYTKHGVADRM